MLELEMDIEADLGIDSIKRVEILGAMRDQFPQLPQLKAEELAELRTLQQIVDYMKDHAGTGTSNGHSNGSNGAVTDPKAQASTSNGNGHTRPALAQLNHDIPRMPAHLHYLPAPDYAEFKLPAGAICVVTDDGTALAGEMVHRLIGEGVSVVVLRFPSNIVSTQSNLPAGVASITLPDMSE